MTLSPQDRLDILELLARADNAATARDVATYVALFSDDGILDGDKGMHQGRQALADAVGEVWAGERTSGRHLTLNSVVPEDAGSDGHATATSTLLIVDPGPPPTLLVVSAIVQQLVKTAAGWRIARRTVGGP